ncbi:MAG TPA: VWA domain-containing protein [Pyrinomonadaceae bacterium]|jgi:VWFA-related protein|nr:VWA domain-containing protein [Pyrinomonadaceae bacterium]
MISSNHTFARLLFSSLLCLALTAASAHAQQNNQTSSPQETDDILRIRTELVQTDVLVLDKQGRFVDNLARDQFELKVDGKPQAISFFERVRAGTADEESQLAAARGLARTSTASGAPVVHPVDRGRTVFFFLDDVHLSADSLGRARKVVLRFINEEMSANDEVVVASASGQIGFLQQLTNNRAVLRAAVARLGYKQYIQTRGEFPEISEYQAFTIEEQNDQALFNYFVGEMLRDDPNLRPEIAQTIIRGRVQRIVQQSNFYVNSALLSLETFMRSSSQIPGRKLFYFISDGFLLNIRSSNVADRLRRITDAALRSGSVIYTIDARGLALDPDQESTARPSFDLTGTRALRAFAERTVPQEPLYRLAEDTGGRALVNTNALSASVSQVLKETSTYYLLAWRPETTEQAGGNKFRQVEVSVRDRPELKVLVQRGYFDKPPETPAKPAQTKNKKAEEKPTANTPSSELVQAVISQRQHNALPTSLSVGYTKEPAVGMMLTASVEINDDALSTSSQDASKPAQNSIADVLAVVLNDQGKVVNGFKQELTITPPSADASRQRHFIVYSHRLPVAPGLYQIRVSARDRLSGRTGNAAEWIEIPDPNKGQLALSSLFIGERTASDAPTNATGPQQEVVVLNPNRRFARNSRLRFNLQIYNAARGASQPDVAVQVQVFRGEQPVVTTALRKVSTQGVTDLSQLPYAAEVLLDKMPVGQYVLRVTAIDRIAKASASQQINFAIE